MVGLKSASILVVASLVANEASAVSCVLILTEGPPTILGLDPPGFSLCSFVRCCSGGASAFRRCRETVMA